jgi:hypothetical protein
MAFDLLERGPFGGQCCEDAADKFAKGRRNVERNKEVSVDNAGHCFGLCVRGVDGLGFEWSFSRSHFVDENSQTPNVDLFVIVFSLEDFGRDIIEGATEGYALTK